jgi:ABC-type antimicrobial peptide transport system permease subunit
MFVARTTTGTTLDPVALRARVQAEIATPQTVGVGEELDTLTGGLRDDRFRTTLFAAFGVLGLVLAAVGLYAVTSFEATLRHLEMGVRLALGATPGQVKRLIIQDAIRPVAIGIALGLGASYWAATFLQVFLHGVDARDPWTLAIVGATLGMAAVVAAWLPAHRASHTDPATTLRAQ